jgi:hypothetical protein
MKVSVIPAAASLQTGSSTDFGPGAGQKNGRFDRKRNSEKSNIE